MFGNLNSDLSSFNKHEHEIPELYYQLSDIWSLWLVNTNTNMYYKACQGNLTINSIYKKNPTKCNNVSKFYYFIFIWSSTRFGRYTSHHQEPKTALATSGFSYVKGCWTCSWWTLSGTDTGPGNVHQLHVHQPYTYEKPDTASAVLGSWWWAVCRPKHVELHRSME